MRSFSFGLSVVVALGGCGDDAPPSGGGTSEGGSGSETAASMTASSGSGGTSASTTSGGSTSGTTGEGSTGEPAPDEICPDASCRVLWVRGAEWSGVSPYRSLALHPSGGLVAGLLEDSANAAQHYVGVVRIGADGSELARWAADPEGGSAGQGDDVPSVVVDASGRAYALVEVGMDALTVDGVTAEPESTLVIAFDEGLGVRWARAVPGKGEALVLGGDGVFVGGTFAGTGDLGEGPVVAAVAESYVVRIAQDGTHGWASHWASASEDQTQVRSVVAAGQGSLVLARGQSVVIEAAAMDPVFAVEFDADGNVTRTAAMPNSAEALFVAPEGYVAAAKFLDQDDFGGGLRTSESWATALVYFDADLAYVSDVAWTGSHGDVLRDVSVTSADEVVLAGKVYDRTVDFGMGPISPDDQFDHQGYVRIYDATGTLVDQVALIDEHDNEALVAVADDETIYIAIDAAAAEIADATLDPDLRFYLVAVRRIGT